MPGRTVPQRWDRYYFDGLDMSGYGAALGPLTWSFDEVDFYASSDNCQSALPGMPHISPGTFNGIFDNTATVGLHALASGAGVKRLVTLARGIQAAPALGDPCFTCYAVQDDYMAVAVGQAQMVNIKFGHTDDSTVIAFPNPWGPLLHPVGAETGVNSSPGADDLISPAVTSANGGYFWYHALSSNGTLTLKAQHASVSNLNASFADITGATSGSIDPSAAPKFGIVATAVGLSISRWLRFQLVLGSATSVTFVAGFCRG